MSIESFLPISKVVTSMEKKKNLVKSISLANYLLHKKLVCTLQEIGNQVQFLILFNILHYYFSRFEVMYILS